MPECPTHPGADAVDTCTRCGRFFCLPERFQLEGRSYCGECGAREDVDWLGHRYRRLEGKRSGFAWFMLPLGLALLGGLLIVLTPGARWQDRLIGLALVIYGAASIGFFTGKPWGRRGLVVGSLAASVALIVGVEAYWGALVSVPMFLLTAAAWQDVRSQLFYRQPVSRLALYAHFHREGSNPLAVSASRLSLLSFFVPGLCLVTLVMGALALSRVDMKAVPPVGNLSAALAAIVVSLLTSAIWVSALLGPLLPGH